MSTRMRFTALLVSALLFTQSVFAEPDSPRTAKPAFIDLHFGTLSGVGWYSNEPGGVVEAVSTQAVSAGSLQITLNGTKGFSRGQLACYQGEDDTLYPVVLKDVEPDRVVIDRPLPKAMPEGGKLYNFYNNDAHANHFGFACVADDALRQLAARPMLRRAEQFKGASGWEVINGAHSEPVLTAGYRDVGDGAGIAIRVGNAGGGVASKPVVSLYENMVTNVVVNPGKQAGKQAATLDIVVTELKADGQVIDVAKSSVTRDDTIASVDIPYTITAGSKVRVKVTVPSSTESVFYPGSITHYHALSPAEDINRGKHVLFGDSWFASGGDFHYHLIKRLNKATVVSKGIVGNRSDQLVARFFKDVPAEKPDYVWIMVGTNDYYYNTTSWLFQAQVTYLVDYIRSIGAKPILFNPTVGAIAPGNGENQLIKSRSYALNTLYVPSVSFLRSPLLQAGK